MLSISIAAYNVSAYLAEALESCLCQHAGELEVIVVNDGSTDNTLEIARGFERERPDVFKVIDKPNGGYGSTINAAIEVAAGKYFRYLDGDDWFDAEMLDSYLELLGGCGEDAVYTPYARVYEADGRLELRDDLRDFDEGSYGMADLQDAPHLAACSLAYRTDLLRDMQFRMTERCFYTDVEYAVLPFAYVKALYVSKLPLYRYRIGREGQSVSLEGIARHYEDIVRVRARLLCEIRDDSLDASSFLRRCLAFECASVYRLLTMIPPDRERKVALRKFDSDLRKRDSLYGDVLKHSMRARLLCATRFLAYTPLCLLSGSGEER